MDTLWFFAYVAAYLILLVWGLILATRDRWWTPANLPLLVVAGLIYDNAVLATGRYLGMGPPLEALSLGRHWIHALVTPLLVVFAWHVIARTGAAWARTRWAAALAVAAATALIVLELTHVVGINLAASREYGVLSYSAAEPTSGPPLMVLLVSLALLVAGISLWRRQHAVWLLVGTLLIILGSAVPVPVASGAVTNAFELVLLFSILMAKHAQDRATARPPAVD